MEQLIQGKMENLDENSQLSYDEDTEIELYMARFESLMDRRPLLLNRFEKINTELFFNLFFCLFEAFYFVKILITFTNGKKE